MRRWFVLVSIASTGAWLQCSSFSATPEVAGLDAAIEAASDDGTPNPIEDGATGCPTSHGEMILIAGAFCIDKYETTYAQYREFLASRDGGLGPQPYECAWMSTLEPYTSIPDAATLQGFPVPNVTWCAARSYCEWAGKRLCGTRGTGENVITEYVNSTADEWYAACSADGLQPYPYGDTYDASACGAVHAVGSQAGCQGGYPGLFDMLGNVEEWESSCTPSGGDAGDDPCFTRGTQGEVDAGVTCKARGRLFRHNHGGIRCCATAAP